MSHELRTPLNGIIGFSQLLERSHFGALTDHQRSFVTGIQSCGWQLYGLLNDMMELADVTAGGRRLALERVPLESILEAGIAGARHAAARRRVLLQPPPADCLLLIDAEPVRLVRAFTAVLCRAVETAPIGGEVSLSTETDDATVCLAVSINEASMEPGELPPPLEAPPAGEPSDTRPGFALAGRVLEMHGGRLEVNTQCPKAPLMRMVLPFVRESRGFSENGHAS